MPSFPDKARSPVFLKHNEDSDSLVNETHTNKSPQRSAIKEQESLKHESSNKSVAPRFSSSLSFEEGQGFWHRILGKCLGIRKLKALKMRVNFGLQCEQDFIKKFASNYVRTTKFY